MQGTMVLVSSHSDLYTTVQEKCESLEDYYKAFIARKNTVNTHGAEAGRHKELYRSAREKIMTEMKVDEIYMSNVNNRAVANKIDLEASTKSREQFLACLFILMADKVEYKQVKDLFNNKFIMGKRS